MRLRQYTLRNLSVPLLLILSAWACAFYITIIGEINEETDESLTNHKMLIIKAALADSTLLTDHVDILTQYYIREIPPAEADLSRDVFFDSTRVVPLEMISIPVRGLRTCFRTSDDKYYELTIITSILEKEDMVRATVIGLAILYFSLVFCILLVIHLVFRKSLHPLYVLFDWLKKYRLGKTNIPLRNETKIEEFHILNEAIEDVVRRNTKLYNMQKQFVENAAHELQTPLAICMNKLELMSENPACTERQLSDIASLHQTLSGIVKMNKSLLLLSRIENRQFPETSRICMNKLISGIQENLDEMYEHKHITVTVKSSAQLFTTMNESLATTLLMNLIKNAYIHNCQDGIIRITITAHTLTVANSSNAPRLNASTLFDRYERQSRHKESTGLGLAIVKSIAALYEIQVEYDYDKQLHEFKLTFK